jgi:hypothetical protein
VRTEGLEMAAFVPISLPGSNELGKWRPAPFDQGDMPRLGYIKIDLGPLGSYHEE